MPTAATASPPPQRGAGSFRPPEGEGEGEDLDKKSLESYLSVVDIQQIFTTSLCQALAKVPRVWQYEKGPNLCLCVAP